MTNFLFILALLLQSLSNATISNAGMGGTFVHSSVFVGDGNSITVGLGAATPYTAQLTGFTTVYNVAVSGQTMATMLANESTTVIPKCSGGHTLVNLWSDGNDFVFTTPAVNASDVYGWMVTYVANAHASGCRVMISTMLSRSCAAMNGLSCDQNKDILNPLIMTNTAGADGIVNFTPTVLGCDGCYTNMTYFQMDAVHPTQTGITTVETPTIQAVASTL